MYVKVDPQVFKILDSRVQALKCGKLSLQQFVYTIRTGDYLVFVKDTVYALTQLQFNAAKVLIPPATLSQEHFKALLEDIPQQLSEEDKTKFEQIRASVSNCSTCKYKHYKQTVQRIIQDYADLKQTYLQPQEDLDELIRYPKTRSAIQSKIRDVLPKFFVSKVPTNRKPCLDCVQKHIGCAYIKGCEVQQGYPQHFVLAMANLQQAYQEAPKDAEALRETLLFCIAKSKAQKTIFIPLGLLLQLVQMQRYTQAPQSISLRRNTPDQHFQLQLTAENSAVLSDIPLVSKLPIISDLNKLIALQYSAEASKKSAQWQGYMSSIADMLLPFSKQVANTLRNRRLLFKAAPQLVQNTQYDCKDVLQALKRNPKG